MAVVGLSGNTWPAPRVPHALALRQRHQQPCKLLGRQGSWTCRRVCPRGVASSLGALTGAGGLQQLAAGVGMENGVERLVKVHGARLGWPARCPMRWPPCQSQKFSNTRAESTCKYEQPECLRWVSYC